LTLETQSAIVNSNSQFRPAHPAAKGKPMKMNNLFTAAYYYYYFTGYQR
jgi:hypothetical protein